MVARTVQALKAQIAARVEDNDAGDISASDVRSVLTDIVDSYAAAVAAVSTGGAAAEYSGAQVSYSAQVPSSGAFAAVPNWTEEVHDVGGWFDTAAPAKFVVPAGVARVQLFASVRGNGLSDPLITYIRRRRGGVLTTVAAQQAGNEGGSAIFTMVSPVVDVAENDEFELWKFSNDSSFTLPTTMNFSIVKVS